MSTSTPQFQIISTTKVGSIPFVTIDNYEKYLKEVNTFLFCYRDLYEAQEFILKYGKGYKKYFMMPEQSHHILSMSLTEKIDDGCNKLTKAEFNITTRGGYRPLTIQQVINFSNQSGFDKIEGFCYSPLEKRKTSKKMKQQRQIVIKKLKEMVEEKTKNGLTIEIIASIGLTGLNDDIQYVKDIIQTGIHEIVFDCEYIEDKDKILDFIQNIKDLCNNIKMYVKLYSFNLSQIIQAALMNVSIWTNSINEFTLHGQAFVFPLSINQNNNITSIDLYNTCYKDVVNDVCVNGCECFSCKSNQSRAYIHHLLLCHELTGTTLLSLHNFHYIHKLEQIINSLLLNDRTKLQQLADFYNSLIPPPEFQKVKLYADHRTKENEGDDD
ncbi:hypothetical protein ENUP19_0003G0042 [Entamoeba nuttalli]|uniref:tRNA-guanine(15) transglycosylase-like domain-containing protein n=1 Tax=Entamoeba nuttalli TaxID=412467 RepID=A0ABQ0D7C5_9EUKA